MKHRKYKFRVDFQNLSQWNCDDFDSKTELWDRRDIHSDRADSIRLQRFFLVSFEPLSIEPKRRAHSFVARTSAASARRGKARAAARDACAACASDRRWRIRFRRRGGWQFVHPDRFAIRRDSPDTGSRQRHAVDRPAETRGHDPDRQSAYRSSRRIRSDRGQPAAADALPYRAWPFERRVSGRNRTTEQAMANSNRFVQGNPDARGSDLARAGVDSA